MPENQGKNTATPTTASLANRKSTMGRSFHTRRSRPYREFQYKGHAGQEDQGVYLPLRVCEDKSRAS